MGASDDRWIRRLLFVMATLLAVAGCGPISSTTHLIDARDQFKVAKREEAKTFAPYEYTKAELYLRKAKELQGYSEYQQSMVFAIRAKDMSVEAVKVSRRNKAKQARMKLIKRPVKPTTKAPVIPETKKKTIKVIGPGGAR